jgi:probable F420-dependent oxidoreductase
MRFWLSMMAVPEIDQLIELAQHAESVGFYGCTYADHLVMPTKIASKYPYTADGEIFWPLDAPWPDPWIALSVLGSHTKTIRLITNIYLAALRDPFTVARMVSTASAFSNGRILCGVSAGWLKEEYDAAQVDFASRGRRLDEIIAAARKLWTGDIVSHKGEFFDFDSVIMRPAPIGPVEVWVGGGSPPALRRAAANDGWLGLPMTVEQNVGVARKMYQIRAELGLPSTGFSPCISLIEPLTRAASETLQAAGVNDIMSIPYMPTPWENEGFVPAGADISKLAVKKDAVSRYAERVIHGRK